MAGFLLIEFFLHSLPPPLLLRHSMFLCGTFVFIYDKKCGLQSILESFCRITTHTHAHAKLALRCPAHIFMPVFDQKQFLSFVWVPDGRREWKGEEGKGRVGGGALAPLWLKMLANLLVNRCTTDSQSTFYTSKRERERFKTVMPSST